MKHLTALILTLALAFPVSASVSTTPADVNNYCLGEWTETAESYCQNVMTYVMALVVDRNVNVRKSAVMNDIPKAVQTYMIPEELAHNYIEFIWTHPKGFFEPSEAANYMFGGCIDNYEILRPQPLK